ncbi:MAG: PadR family transcriptional regulator [Clostridia bacterium]|nr:PadR family transcriptional regulator [Clostridia bacterium]MBQ6805678.1 PadR family transcriptional regulator [Clostridia bacterium]
MDAQLKRGMIEVCILSILTRGDSYGYQLIKDIEPIMALSESTLYPVLRRLEAADCLSVYSVEHNSRLRKYYAITDTGRQRIADFLKEWEEVNRVYDFIVEVNRRA